MLRARDWIFHKVGEDWIFLALLGIIMALLSFAMDFIIEKMQEGEVHFSLYTAWFTIQLKVEIRLILYFELNEKLLILIVKHAKISVLNNLTIISYMLQIQKLILD